MGFRIWKGGFGQLKNTSIILEILKFLVIITPMNTIQASKLFESLSSPIRLAIFQQLTAAGSTGMIAGDLAKQLNLAPNNVSFHLNSLLHSGLVRVVQEGRHMRYFAELDLMMALTHFLTQNCCSQTGESCQ